LQQKKQQMENKVIDNKEQDVTHNWVSTSRFIWYCQIFAVVAIILSACVAQYQHRYKGKPKVEVPENTLYNPTYK
jgi:uncharacterized protein YbbK (DUF523 family)